MTSAITDCGDFDNDQVVKFLAYFICLTNHSQNVLSRPINIFQFLCGNLVCKIHYTLQNPTNFEIVLNKIMFFVIFHRAYYIFSKYNSHWRGCFK